MSSALSIALSALQAQSEGIDTTGNNLANMNTTGFKGSTADFEDLMSQYMGVGAGQAVGTGVARPINQQLFTQGPLQGSNSPLATAIQGNGFFMVNDPSGAQLYTRDGNFTISQTGVLQTQTGENVQGWTIGPTGMVNTSTVPGDITLPTGAILPPQVTQNFSLSMNLDSNTPAGNPWSTTVTAVDSLGNTHVLAATFTPTATANTWNYQVTIPAADLTNGTPPTTGDTVSASNSVTVASTAGIVVGQSVSGAGIPAGTTVAGITSGTAFTLSAPATATANGVPLTFGTTVPIVTPGTLTFNPDGTLQSGTPSSVVLTVPTLADGASIGTGQLINWNLFDSNNSPLITQYGTTSAVSATQQDGTLAAQLTSVAIQNGGSVVATFSNGKQMVEAQLALASIQNPDSLENAGNNNFSATANTSAPAVGLPQSGGRGQILGGQLEGSNVDMATEFTNLITYQSGYQASSRVITTVNTLTQDLMNLIR
ncbi:MAG TPA: flagellar hook-basal body complex protein [Bryobacteraceae bacterium]